MSKVFISSLRYSIYKVQPLASKLTPFIGQLAHFSTAFYVCQELFSFLVKFFMRCFMHLLLSGALAYINRQISNCQALFSFFYDFFIFSKPCVRSGIPTQNTAPLKRAIPEFMCNPHNFHSAAAVAQIHTPCFPLP